MVMLFAVFMSSSRFFLKFQFVTCILQPHSLRGGRWLQVVNLKT